MAGKHGCRAVGGGCVSVCVDGWVSVGLGGWVGWVGAEGGAAYTKRRK